MAAGIAAVHAKAVIDKLRGMAAHEVANEATLNDFGWLKTKFSFLSGLLLDADYQQSDEQSKPNEAVKEWARKAVDICLDTEDMLDQCVVYSLYTSPTQSFVRSFSQLILRRYKMGRRIKDLKHRMGPIIDEGVRLWKGRTELIRRSHMVDSDLQPVAIKDKVEHILSLLETNNPPVGVVAVVGMGGIGKSFLVYHVYSKATDRYENSAWISVSQSFSLRSLQCNLASQIGLEINSNISDVRVSEIIHERLEGKNCLIVLDDMWMPNDNLYLSNFITRLGIPMGGNHNCKILVTTRTRNLYPSINVCIYQMELLSAEDSWKLFCIYAFPDSEKNRPPHQLENLAYDVERECGRLPLAVKMVASSMANSRLEIQWESKLMQLKQIPISKEPIMQILKPSYDSLPPHLKACFAYFCFFPKGYPIPCDYLIHLWMVEGFIPEGEYQWDIGLDYLLQLSNLCLVEVPGGPGGLLGSSSFCYLHGLLLDLAIHISTENRCEFALPSLQRSCRRILAAQKGIGIKTISQSSLHGQQFLRTLSLSTNFEIQHIPEHLFDRLRMLRVLDFSYTEITTLPDCVGNLQLLKVLNLSGTHINEVPKCVRRLKRLQFLDLSLCTSLARLPDWIGELKSLSYLSVILCPPVLRYMPKGISNLINLKRLRSSWLRLSIEESELLNLKDVSNMIHLQELRFSINDKLSFKNVEDGILEHLVKLQHLGVWNNISPKECDTELILLSFPEKMKSLKYVQTLHHCWFYVPSWVCALGSLRELVLTYCSSDYPALQKMHSLEVLFLNGNDTCTELPGDFGKSGAFPRLSEFSIQDFPLLEEFPALEDGAMKRLSTLKILDCQRAKKLPGRLERLKKLKRIKCKGRYGYANELMERLKEGGEDWNNIKANNPSITIDLVNRYSDKMVQL